MQIFAFIQVYNESITGNLVRCLNNCKKWADEIIIYDDKSTDNSVEIAKKYTNNIILGEKNEWKKETFHKQTMLEYIHNMKIKPNWILWLDCDEIVDINTINEIRSFCELNNTSDIDAFSFQQINLWRGERYYRTDGVLYGENFRAAGWFVRLWKYQPNLCMNTIIGPDQILYPSTIKNIKPCHFKIIHYGFSNYKLLMKHIGVHLSTKQELINTANGNIYLDLANKGIEWAKTYVINGKGVTNMFLNEENLTVKYCPTQWFPIENIPHDYYEEPKPFLISELITYNEIPSILFLGNCQMRVIKDYCMFYLKYNIDYLNIVYDLETHSDRVDFLIKNATIIVCQPFYVGNKYYNNLKIDELKNDKCKLIIVHSLYYDGYFPQENYNNLEKNSDLVNTIIQNSTKSLENIYKRENSLDDYYIKIDVPLYDFIKDNLQKRRLFLRHNHPSNYLMNKYAFLIYNKITCDNEYFQKKSLTPYNNTFENSPERLNNVDTYTDIYTFVYEALRLEWPENDKSHVK